MSQIPKILKRCFDCPYNQIHFVPNHNNTHQEIHHLCYYKNPQGISFEDTIDIDDNSTCATEDGELILNTDEFMIRPKIPSWCPLPDTPDQTGKVFAYAVPTTPH